MWALVYHEENPVPTGYCLREKLSFVTQEKLTVDELVSRAKEAFENYGLLLAKGDLWSPNGLQESDTWLCEVVLVADRDRWSRVAPLVLRSLGVVRVTKLTEDIANLLEQIKQLMIMFMMIMMVSSVMSAFT